jgi:cysteine desulfurase
MSFIYLDHAASTPLHPLALSTLQHSLATDFANPSAAHPLGRRLLEEINGCRQKILSLLQAPSKGRFLFTSSATEANNMLLQGLLKTLPAGGRIFYSSADHPSLTQTLRKCSPPSLHLQEIPLLATGEVNLPLLATQLPCCTLFVLSHVNNHSGTIAPLFELCSLIRKISPQTHIHIDASQSFAKIPLSLRDLPIDSMSFSAHKMGGPKGVAGLYLAKNVVLPPLLYGGDQEEGLRSSTLCASLILGWQAAISAALEENQGQISQRLERLTFLGLAFKERLQHSIPAVLFPFGPSPQVSPYILTFIVPGLSSDILLRHLAEKNIFLSSSSACSSRIKGESTVFKALNLPSQFHKNVLRASLGPQTTGAELECLAQALEVMVAELLELKSPSTRKSHEL